MTKALPSGAASFEGGAAAAKSMSVLQEAFSSLGSAQKAAETKDISSSPHKVGTNRDPSGSPPAQRPPIQQSTAFDLASAQSNILSTTQDTFKKLVVKLKERVKELAKVMLEATVEQQQQDAFASLHIIDFNWPFSGSGSTPRPERKRRPRVA